MSTRKATDSSINRNSNNTTYSRILYPDFEYTAAQLKAIMATKKKRDLEIIYNLQWKPRSNGGEDKQANIVGIYDVPQTTLNWNTFKSYLLKNSGTTGDDVKVSYISDVGEVPVNSQRDFEIALYTFRAKARNGEVITLWLDRISEKKMKKMVRTVNDAQTQATGQQQQQDSKTMTEMGDATPPEWFKKYMKHFRRELIDDVKGMIEPLVTAMAQMETQHANCRSYPLVATAPRHEWKHKHDGKRHNRQSARAPDRDLIKSIKYQSKLENKLEKLERKTLKLKEKKAATAAVGATRSSDSDAPPSLLSSPIGLRLEDLEMHYNAKPAEGFVQVSRYVEGGETFLQEWKVINCGDLAWDANTDLRFAWGHEDLVPVMSCVPAPHLKPSEEGSIGVALQVPTTPGRYESYWYFYHKGRRFGHWLGCAIVVEEPALSTKFKLPNDIVNATVEETFRRHHQETLKPENTEMEKLIRDIGNNAEEIKSETKSVVVINANDDTNNCIKQEQEAPKQINNKSKVMIVDLKKLNFDYGSAKLKPEKSSLIMIKKVPTAAPANGDANEEDATSSSSSDTDNQSIISISDSNSGCSVLGSDEFVMVSQSEGNEKVENDVQNEVKEEDEEEATANVTDDANNNGGDSKKEGKTSKYAYITIDGKKLAVPKCFLHEEYLATAEDAPDPNEPQPNESIGAITKTVEPAITTTTTTPLPLQTTPTQSPFNKTITAETQHTFSNDFGKVTQSSTTAPPASTFHPIMSTSAGEEAVDLTCDYNNGAMSKSCTERGRTFVFPAAVPGFEVVSYADNNEEGGSFVANNDGGELRSDEGLMMDGTMTSPEPVSHVLSYEEFASHGIPAPFNLPPWPSYSAANFSNCVIAQTEQPKRIPCPLRNLDPTPAPIPPQPQGYLLPGPVMVGVSNVASSAINTAKSVFQRINPVRSEEQPGQWINGHWVTTRPDSKRDINLRVLDEMGFKNRDYNATILNRYNDDIEPTIFYLLNNDGFGQN